MLLLAYLLGLNQEWVDTNILVRTIVESEEERSETTLSLEKLISDSRINAEADVIVKPAGQTIASVIHQYSQNSEVVFMGLMIPKVGEVSEYADRLIDLASGLKTTIFVLNAGEFAGDLI